MASLIWVVVAILIAFLGTFGMEWLKPALFRNGISSVFFGTGTLFMLLSFCGIAVDDEAMWGAYIIAHVLAYVMVALSVLDVMFWRRRVKLLHPEWANSIYDHEEFNELFYEASVEVVTFGYLNDYLDDKVIIICCYNAMKKTVVIWR